jgi:hypothetical protein
MNKLRANVFPSSMPNRRAATKARIIVIHAGTQNYTRKSSKENICAPSETLRRFEFSFSSLSFCLRMDESEKLFPSP